MEIKNKFVRWLVRALLSILYNLLGEALEKEIGTSGKNAIHNALLCD